jgi:hypothetical protein
MAAPNTLHRTVKSLRSLRSLVTCHLLLLSLLFSSPLLSSPLLSSVRRQLHCCRELHLLPSLFGVYVHSSQSVSHCAFYSFLPCSASPTPSSSHAPAKTSNCVQDISIRGRHQVVKARKINTTSVPSQNGQRSAFPFSRTQLPPGPRHAWLISISASPEQSSSSVLRPTTFNVINRQPTNSHFLTNAKQPFNVTLST